MEKNCDLCIARGHYTTCPDCAFRTDKPNGPGQLPIGLVLEGRYVVGRSLGQGGFAVTYLCWDKLMSRMVAIKELYPKNMVQRVSAQDHDLLCTVDEAEFRWLRTKFLKEARTQAKLQHIPQVAVAYDLFEAHGTAYILMEYVQGTTLKDYIRDHGRMTPAETFRLMKPILEALVQVHRAEVVHRDIAPDNLVYQPHTGLRLLDFGIARDMTSNGKTSLMITYKPGYSPTEQHITNGQIGPWTDVYAICATMWYCMTGREPEPSNDLDYSKRSLDWSGIPGLTAAQRKALEKGTAIRHENRWQSVQELMTALTKPQKPEKKPNGCLRVFAAFCAFFVAECLFVNFNMSPVPGAVAAVLVWLWMSPKKKRDAKRGPKPKKTAPQRTKLVQQHTQPVHTVPVEQHTVPVQPKQQEFAAQAEEWINSQRKSLPMLRPDAIEPAWDNEYGAAAPVFGTDLRRKEVYTVTFLDSLAWVPEQTCWDLSAAGDRRVLAWAENAQVEAQKLEEQFGSHRPSKLYHLYIAGDGGVALPENCRNLFKGYESMTKLDLSGVNTAAVTDMQEMFSGCSFLTSLDVSRFDTSRVTNMGKMFFACERLTSLDVGQFDTGHVTDMNRMFSCCYALTELDVRRFRTGLVTDMTRMFAGCRKLHLDDLSGWDVRGVQAHENFMEYGQTVNGRPWRELFEQGK